MRLLFFLALFYLSIAHATVPVDIVFDIDQTLATMIHDGLNGDTLADPLHPNKDVISVSFDKTDDIDGKKIVTKVTERYRVYEGVPDLMAELKRQQDLGRVRVSFFSGGTDARNKAILDAITMQDGSSLSSLAPNRIYGRDEMVPTGLGPEARIRERFKKDLTIVNPNLEDVILIDDIKSFVPDSQLGHVLWIDEAYPYPERIWERADIQPTPLQKLRESKKYQWISDYLLSSIDKRYQEGRSLSKIIQEVTENGKKTPFSPGEEIHFENGKLRLLNARPCNSTDIFKTLSYLLK